MSETGAIVFEVSRLIDQDSFYARLDGLVDDIESRLRDGTRKGDLEWEIEDLKNDLAMLKPKERPRLRPAELASNRNAVKTDLFMFNRLLQLQANAELRGVAL